MNIRYSSLFKKQYKKLSPDFQLQFQNRVRLFMLNRTDPRLRVHPLKGRFTGYWCMSVNGDLRALYRDDGDQIILFAMIGTHS